MKRFTWPVLREVFLDTGGVHYVWLGLLTLTAILKGGEHMEIAILVIVCILLAIALIGSIIWLAGTLMSKSKRAKVKADIEEVEKGIKDVKEDIDECDTAMNASTDEGLRKMLRLEKDRHTAKLHMLESKRDSLKTSLK